MELLVEQLQLLSKEQLQHTELILIQLCIRVHACGATASASVWHNCALCHTG
jgi:hypothetical protein